MRKPPRTTPVLSILAVVAGVALLGGQVASAAPRSAVTGSITVVSNVANSTKQAGENTKTSATAQVTFSGDLAGTATERYTAVTHRNGKVNLHGKGFFEGTLDGRTGSLQYVFRGDANGGVIVIVHAGGGLAGTHGQLRYVALGGPNYSYSGRAG